MVDPGCYSARFTDLTFLWGTNHLNNLILGAGSFSAPVGTAIVIGEFIFYLFQHILTYVGYIVNPFIKFSHRPRGLLVISVQMALCGLGARFFAGCYGQFGL